MKKRPVPLPLLHPQGSTHGDAIGHLTREGHGPSRLPSDLCEAPFPDCIAAATLLQALADLRDPREADDARRAIEDGSLSFWLSLLPFEEGMQQRIAAHLRTLAAQEAHPAKAPPDLPDLPEPVPPRMPGDRISAEQLCWAQHRAREGWTQRQIAAALGVTQSAVSHRLRQQSAVGPPDAP